jgi:hypothetical protein
MLAAHRPSRKGYVRQKSHSTLVMAPPLGVVAVGVRFHHWRLGFRQSSFHHIARVLQGTILHAFRWPLLLRQALVPSGFRLQVSRMTPKHPFELLLTTSGIQHRVPRRTRSPHTATACQDHDRRFLSASQPGFPGIQGRNSTLTHLTSCGPSPCTRLSRAQSTMATLTPSRRI